LIFILILQIKKNLSTKVLCPAHIEQVPVFLFFSLFYFSFGNYGLEEKNKKAMAQKDFDNTRYPHEITV